jgi:hypothetical protein
MKRGVKMVNYDVAIKKPFSDVKNLIIGILLCLIPVVNFFALGYIVEQSKKFKEKKLSEFKGWGDLFVKGLLVVLIGIIYFLPAFFIILLAAASVLAVLFKSAFTMGFFTGPKMMMYNASLIGPEIIRVVPWIILAGMLAIVAFYVLPMAFVGFVSTGRFADAFEFGKIFRKCFSGKYLGTWLIAVLVHIFLMAAIGWIFWIGPAFVMFTTGVFAYTLFGQVNKEV